MTDRQKSTSTYVDPTVSDFDCLHEKMYDKSRFGNNEKKKCFQCKKIGIVICSKDTEAVLIKGKRILSTNHVIFALQDSVNWKGYAIYLSIYLYMLQHPLVRIMCSCVRQKKQSVIEEIVLDCRRTKSKNSVS